MIHFKRIMAIAVILAVFLTLPACQKKQDVREPKTVVKVAALKGPTGIGMVKLMEDDASGISKNDYQFTLTGAPDEIVGKISTGEVDVAAVPTNLAAVLYNKTGGKVRIAALNTLGVLYIVEKGQQIKSVSDLKGRTIFASGKGSTPEYILNFILQSNGLVPGTDVKLEYKSEHTEVSTLAAAGQADVVMLPEPFVTTTIAKNKELRAALDLTKEWQKACDKAGKPSNVLSMGALIVRTDFLKDNKDAFNQFLDEYKQSTDYVNENTDQAAGLVEKYAILPSAAVAKAAIPNCNIVYIGGDEMKKDMEVFYKIFFDADPKSVGGKMPGDDFYYVR